MRVPACKTINDYTTHAHAATQLPLSARGENRNVCLLAVRHVVRVRSAAVASPRRTASAAQRIIYVAKIITIVRAARRAATCEASINRSSELRVRAVPAVCVCVCKSRVWRHPFAIYYWCVYQRGQVYIISRILSLHIHTHTCKRRSARAIEQDSANTKKTGNSTLR